MLFPLANIPSSPADRLTVPMVDCACSHLVESPSRSIGRRGHRRIVNLRETMPVKQHAEKRPVSEAKATSFFSRQHPADRLTVDVT